MTDKSMRITRVYTRTGDDGTTGLADGSRVSKTSMRLETYGTVDELNTVLGLCLAYCSELSESNRELCTSWLVAIQNDLFNLGGDLATPIAARWKDMIVVSAVDVQQLEKMIDRCQLELSPLREFVLPGGSLLNGYLHLARTVCRRAERLCVALAAENEINPVASQYLNRLSDLMFVMSRWSLNGGKEVTWSKTGGVRGLLL
jgi:cob(I)alamin adenosyltransferase